jgi:hypothetical protein
MDEPELKPSPAPSPAPSNAEADADDRRRDAELERRFKAGLKILERYRETFKALAK